MRFLAEFSLRVKENPDTPALVDQNGARITSYAELDLLSGRVAAKLQSSGLKKDDVVVIRLGRQMEYIAAELGCLKAGCPFIPILPTYPEERVAFILEDSEAKYLLEEDFFEGCSSFHPALAVESSGDDRSMIVYTSGSTGKPKGVLYRAEVFDASLDRLATMFAAYEKPLFGASAPMSFVALLFEYPAILALGGCSHILSDEIRQDLAATENYYAEHRLTHGFISPRMLRLYRNKDAALVRVITGSERVVDTYSPDFEIYNLYGASEGMLMCGFLIDRKYDNTPIGTAPPGIITRLLDEKGKEIEGQGEGELCAEGLLPREYIKRPEDSAERFEELPDGKIRLHTGDIGRRLADGNLVYVSRKDWMVKINGQRVEPGEIEAAMKALPGVEAAACRDFTAANGQVYLCGYYVAQQDLENMGDLLAEKLPNYMVPAHFIRLPKIPLNVNGKLDRFALPVPEVKQNKMAYVAPGSDEEKMLCSAFEEVLKCGQVGIYDDFFALGGDSIKVMELQNLCGHPGLSSSLIFSERTPAKISEAMDEMQEDLLAEAMQEERAEYPLTASQMGLYLECMQNPDGTMYNIPLEFALAKSSGVDIEKLAEAIRAAISNHAALMSRLEVRDGLPCFVPCQTSSDIPLIQTADAEKVRKDFVRPFSWDENLYRILLVETPEEYIVLMDFHHLVFDGTSLSVLLREIGLAYEGKDLPAEEATQFNLGIYEEMLSKSPAYAQAKSYFDGIYAGLDCNANLVTDYPEDSSLNNKPAANIVLRSPEGLSTARLEAYALQNGLTVNSILLGGFEYTLAKFSAETELTLCTANHGRHDSRLQNTVGMMVRTLPLFVKIEEKQRIVEFLKDVQENLLGAMEHDIYPFLQMAEDYGLSADYKFVYQNDALESLCLGDQRIPVVNLPLDSAQGKLTIMVFKESAGYRFEISYRRDLFSDENIRSFVGTYLQVLEQFMTAERLADMDLLSPSARKMLDEFNETEVAYDRSKSVVDLFRAQAARSPDHTAVVYLEKRYSYRELDDISERIGAFLQSQGIGREDVVSILIPRCEYMPIAALGVLKAGAAYQPLDPTYPADRLAYMMADASVKFLIAEESLLDLLPGFQGQLLLTRDIPTLPAGGVIGDQARPEDLFIMLYTSGTTGRPKGVMLEHRNLAAFCNWYHRYYKLTDQSRIAAYASFGFDANMMDTYPALTAGAAVHVIPDAIRLDLPKLADYYETQQITHAFITTQVGRLFADTVEKSSLGYLSVGGEKLTPIEPPENYPLYNVYGPTECTILITAFPVDRLYMRVPIGQALDNTKLYVVDKQERRLPAGAVGELCAAGHQVGRGYLNLPEETATAFTPNPFCTGQDYDRMYRTGDDVRILPDGNIDFIGRRDGQVKIRGFRIELEEVEKIILSYPGIKNAVVVANEAPGGGQCLVSYIVSDERIDLEALHAYIADKKPAYMVPSASMQIEKIPLNVNGKLDRKALPQIEMSAAETVMPQNAFQQRIFECVAEVIGSKSFGIRTDLFAAGLTSISVIRLSAALAKEFGVSVGFAEIRDNETVEKLGILLQSVKEEEIYEVRSEYPLTQTQQGIFVESLKNPHTTIYNIPYLIKPGARVDAARLQKAVSSAIDAHPYIKSILHSNDAGEVLSLRRDDAAPRVDIISCAYLPEARDILRPFDLIGNELYRAEIYKTEHDIYLYLDLHHILCDGESLRILLSDIDLAYAGEVLERENYTGFEVALDEQKKLESPAYEKARAHYDRIFAGCDTDFLPVTDRQDEMPSVANVSYKSELTAAALESFCKTNAVTPNAFFNAAMGFVLAEYNYRDDAVFATIYNGRNDSRLSRSVTMLVKTLPVYCNLAGNPKTKDYVKAVQEQLMNSMAADIFSFAEISAAFGLTADILLVYQGEGFSGDTFCGETYEAVPLELDAAKAPLSVSLDFENGRLVLHCEYRSDLYNESTVSFLLSCLNTVCHEFLGKDALSDVELINAKQLELLDEFNDTAVEYDRSKSVVDLFREQVARQPEHTAVIYLDQSYTYREVDELSERIGVYLQSRGIGREDAVGILIPRCEYMPIASMGVLKSGAAFQPLDPSYPAERLEFMLEDAAVRLLIVQEELLYLLPEYQGEILLTKDIPTLPAGGKCKGAPRPEDLMVLLYTSGTTGTPKGVMLEHGNIVAFCNSHAHIFGMGSDTRIGGYASFGFDAGIQDIAATLTTGATLYVIDESIRLDLPALHRYLNDNRISDIMMTTQLGRMFVSGYDFPYLRRFIVGGEKLLPLEPPQGFKLYNGYGPTESMAYVTILHVDQYYSRVPVGRASENIRLYVCDRQGRRLPVGACGELCITGYQVGRGYLNLPEQTAAVFTQNPFSREDGYERMYHTGDVVRYLPDGNVDYIGRRDGQVKIRGFRIEMSEVEQVINSYPGIKNAVVVAKDAPEGGKRIVAYVVSDESIDIEALHAYIADNKPSYMVPSASMQIEKIPLTVNGKLDKRLLPEVEYKSSSKGRAPATPMEKLFCKIYEEVLGIENISAEDSFFELGGSSLTVTRVIIAADKHQINIAFADVFAHPSPAELGAFVENSVEAGLPEFEDLGAYDYGGIEKLLAKNTLQSFQEGQCNPLGQVLLTGVTGYLGIHILRELLHNDDRTVFCLVRPSARLSAAARLNSLYFYYFNQVLSEEYGDRIRVIAGDVTDRASLETCAAQEIDTVINCAANIKHFSKDTDIEDVNYAGVLNLIALCEQTGARLIQTSTVSVGGIYVDEPGPVTALAENQLYIGQVQISKYTQSKFLAERVLLEKIAQGFKGKIMRLGNLGPRERDGEYQINFNTNSFMGRLKANVLVGSYPYDIIEMPFELTPIDDLARAVLLLAQTPDDCTVFHPYNNHRLMMGDMYEAMNAQNLYSRAVELEEYESALAKAKQDPVTAEKLAGLLAYENLAHGQKTFGIGVSNHFTMQLLYRMGFRWPVTSTQYMNRFLEALIGLSFFD